MWSIVKLFAIGMCFGHLSVQRVVGQSDCRFLMDDGTELPEDDFDVHQLENIQDIEKPKDLLVVLAEGVKEITKISSESKSKDLYIQPILEDGNLILKLTDHFANYEEYETSITLAMKITFQCNSGVKTLGLTQRIEDTNNNSPIFQKTPYVYKLPMPFPKSVSLNYFGSISARDIDLTNKNISFHLDPSDPIASAFSVSWLQNEPGDRKIHNATLLTEAVINFAEDVTFTLYATDTGTPTRTSSIDVKIEPDRESSPLQFTRSLYIANLTKLQPGNANEMNITFEEGPISLQGGDDSVVYTIQDHLTAYQDNFELLMDDNSRVQLRLKNPPEKFFLESFVLLSLTAQKPGTQHSTVLHMSLPGRDNLPETSSTTITSVCDCSKDSDNNCNNIGYIVAVIILTILLISTTAGLVVIVMKKRRASSFSSQENKTNGGQSDAPEMKEVIRNGNVSPSGSFRKSVAFNDTVEEIKIARL